MIVGRILIDFWMLVGSSIDYSDRGAGDRRALFGETGWMFVQQVDPILTLKPAAFTLEMVSSASKVHDGSEVDEVCARLSEHYHVHRFNEFRTWRMGDVSNRSRLFIVGFCRERVGQEGARFQFPKRSHL